MPLARMFFAEDAIPVLDAFWNEITAKDWSNNLMAILPKVYEGVDQNFKTTSTPDNVPWLPRKDPTKKHPLLILSGKMHAAATGTGDGAVVRIDNTSLQIGISLDSVKYARAQNQGNPKRNLPAREYFGIKQETTDTIADMLASGISSDLFG